jgi:hypothetical protein
VFFWLVALYMMSGFFGEVRLICGQARRPPIGGSASSKAMSDGASPSIIALAAVSIDSLHSMSMCDVTLPMWSRSCFASLALRSYGLV